MTIERVEGYVVDGSSRIFASEREARQYEFDGLIAKMFHALPGKFGDVKIVASIFSDVLRSGIYQGGTNMFIEAAEYLKDHGKTMRGEK